MSRHPALLCLLLATLACGDGTDPPVFESIAGTYSGSFVSTEPGGDEYVADFDVTVVQSEGALTGSWAVDGVINGRTDSSGDGAFTATIPQGSNPSFSADLAFSFCPQDLMTFTAAFNSSAGTLTLTGGLDVPSSQCDVLTVYPINVTLSR